MGSDVVSGWAGWAFSSVNPTPSRGADYAHHNTASPPGFENPAAALHVKDSIFTKKNSLIFS